MMNRPIEPMRTRIMPMKQQDILRNIQNLDNVNKKLITISDAMLKTSFFTNNKIPTIIGQVQKEMRVALDQLISNIKDFYLDIDSKLRSLCLAVGEAYSQNPEINKKNNTTYNMPQKDMLKILAAKVQGLQNSLQKTQQNQKKLIQVIESICQKHNISEQPTLIKNDSDFGQHYDRMKMQKNKIKSIPSEMGTSHAYSIHEKLKIFNQSEVSDQKNEQTYPDCTIMKLYSKNNYNQYSFNKKSLKGKPNSNHQYTSGEGKKHEDNNGIHSHRLDYLMNTLTSDSGSRQ